MKERNWTYKKIEQRLEKPNNNNAIVVKSADGERFMSVSKDGWESRIEKNGSDECYGWRGGFHRQGYGMFHVQTEKGKAMMTSNRIAASLKLGRVLEASEFAISTCRNLSCTNPDHIIIGTRKDSYATSSPDGRTRYSLAFKKENAKFIFESPTKEVRERFGWSQTKLVNFKTGLKRYIEQGVIDYQPPASAYRR